MNTATVINTDVADENGPRPPLPRLLPKSRLSLGDFFHCSHGVPEHHRCIRCEWESQLLPIFWDRD